MIKLEVYVSTNLVGSKYTGEIEFEEADFEGKDEQEKQDMIDEAVNEWVWEHIDVSYKFIVEEE